eukprot:2184672-Pyramimonas_sp.AAC.1
MLGAPPRCLEIPEGPHSDLSKFCRNLKGPAQTFGNSSGISRNPFRSSEIIQRHSALCSDPQTNSPRNLGDPTQVVRNSSGILGAPLRPIETPGEPERSRSDHYEFAQNPRDPAQAPRDSSRSRGIPLRSLHVDLRYLGPRLDP